MAGGEGSVLWALESKLKDGVTLEQLEEFWELCACLTAKETDGPGVCNYEMHHNASARECVCFEDFADCAAIVHHLKHSAMIPDGIGAGFAATLEPTDTCRICGADTTSGSEGCKELEPMLPAGFALKYDVKLPGSFRRPEYTEASPEQLQKRVRFHSLMQCKDAEALKTCKETVETLLTTVAEAAEPVVLLECYAPGGPVPADQEHTLMLHGVFADGEALARFFADGVPRPGCDGWSKGIGYSLSAKALSGTAGDAVKHSGPLKVCGPAEGVSQDHLKAIEHSFEDVGVVEYQRLKARVHATKLVRE